MGRRRALWAAAAAVTLVAIVTAVLILTVRDDTGASCGGDRLEEGYSALFDGTEDTLEEWHHAGPGEFLLQEDCAILSSGGMGLLWYPQRFTDYRLRLDWKSADGGNSGVFVGFPSPGDDPWVAVEGGYEIQIHAVGEHAHSTGAIYSFQGPDASARDQALHPPGEWNTFEIVVVDQHITVYLNGALINDFENTDPSRAVGAGHIGLQNHGDDDSVQFRNIRIAELSGSQ